MTGPTDAYKIVVVGDGGTGKSTFIRKLVTAQFATQYEPTVSCEVVPVDLETSAGPVRFFCWDTAGQEKFGALRDGYYDKADAAIVFFDVTSRATQKSVGVWITDILRVCGSGLPIVICANKVDLDNRRSKYTLPSMKVPKEAIDDCELIETSVLNGHNILEPLHFIVKAVLGGATLTMPASQGEPGPANSTPLSGKRDTRRTLLKRATDTPLPDGEG